MNGGGAAMSLFEIQNLKVVNEAKAGVPIHSGIGYLDHMIDQLNSHAQVGVGLEVLFCGDAETKDKMNDVSNKNRLADISSSSAGAAVQQSDLCQFVGSKLGEALKELWQQKQQQQQSSLSSSRFCCPLDEALVECTIAPPTSPSTDETGKLETYSLAPYGNFPKTTGRTKIGCLETAAIESFWKGVAESSQLNLSFHKLRGDNGHHIVESSFKAFSRAMRNFLDASPTVFASGSDNDKASIAMNRSAKIERSTKETSILVELQLNGQTGNSKVDTGIPTLDEFFTILADEAHMTLTIQCKGDLWVDDHHTAEDVSIAVGQCLTQALGTKAGLNRMWLAQQQINDNAIVEVTMDLSNRPCLRHNLHDCLGRQEYVEENGNGSLLSCEMLEHVLDSLVMNGRMTVHIVDKSKSAATVKDTVMCTAKAFGQALFVCAMVDQRRAGQTASSKGTLSV